MLVLQSIEYNTQASGEYDFTPPSEKKKKQGHTCIGLVSAQDRLLVNRNVKF
jgi:hypothetical protein